MPAATPAVVLRFGSRAGSSNKTAHPAHQLTAKAACDLVNTDGYCASTFLSGQTAARRLSHFGGRLSVGQHVNARLDTAFIKTIERAIAVLTAFSVPLYIDVNQRPMLRGSGFFVRRGASNYLVSAAHVFDDVAPGQVYFYCAPTVCRHVTGLLLRSGNGISRDEDLIDVAVVKLEGDPQPPYPAVKKAAVDIVRRHTGRPRGMLGQFQQYLLLGVRLERRDDAV